MPRRLACLLSLFCLYAGTALGCGGSGPGTNLGGTDAGVTTSSITGNVAFMMSCTKNEECTTGLCFRYSMAAVGSLCSKTCAAPEDCPAPSRGCNNMGICKSP
ncbi:MAG: hypothetical protein U1E65_02575 [Myxococcota bacterium]